MVKVDDVTFTYESGNQGIQNINFDIQRGECVLFTGKSGSGKSSILRLINGLIPGYHEGNLTGDVHVHSQSIKNQKIYEISAFVSTVFQNPKSQFFNIDTTSEILFYLENIGTSVEEMKRRLDETVNLFNIRHLLDRDILQLSGGEKQIIAIASAFICDTDVIMLDEPTSNLDLQFIQKVSEMIGHLKQAGKTIIISEHRLFYLMEHVDRVFFMADGKLQSVYSIEEFLKIPHELRKKMGLRPLDMNEICIDHAQQSFESAEHIEIKQLIYKYPKSKQPSNDVRDVRLTFGKVICLLGRNGQGKSTFVQNIAGLMRSQKQEIYFNNKRVNHKSRLALSYLVMQDVCCQLFAPSVLEEMVLGKNKHLDGMAPDKAIQMLGLEGLEEEHPLSLSGGQMQRVAIGAGLCSGAKVFILDEPTSGMDYFHMVETAQVIGEIKCADRLMIIVTHDIEFMSMVADEVMVMEQGSIVHQGPLTDEWIHKAQRYLVGDVSMQWRLA